MDSYQAVYDATRSKISNGDVGSAIESAIRDMSLSHYVQMAMRQVEDHAAEFSRPSVLFRPDISIDGDKWLALYGKNLQDGVAGFGDSPAGAMADFDDNWCRKLVRPSRSEDNG